MQTQIEHENDMAIIKIRGILVYVLLDLSPDVYGTYGTTDRKGIKKLVTQCINVTYVTMVASLLCYCKFCKTLKLNKFNMNPCDPYVSNRLVNGLQKSILFHVDYCKLNHNYPKVN